MKVSDPLLEAERLFLSRDRGPGKKRILAGASFALSPGELTFLRGASGIGKSSLLLAVARLLPLEGGRLRLQGRSDYEWAPPHWRERVALVVQKHSMVPGTVKENLLLPWKLKVRRPSSGESGAGPPGDDLMRQELDRVGLHDMELSGNAAELSTGQAARLSFVRTLLTRPGCLLLDEPLAALDPDNAALVLDRIRAYTKAGGAALVVSHDGERTKENRRLRLEGGLLLEEGS